MVSPCLTHDATGLLKARAGFDLSGENIVIENSHVFNGDDCVAGRVAYISLVSLYVLMDVYAKSALTRSI
jgi:hypothetical protein